MTDGMTVCGDDRRRAQLTADGRRYSRTLCWTPGKPWTRAEKYTILRIPLLLFLLALPEAVYTAAGAEGVGVVGAEDPLLVG